ncbi:MAG TPA: tyrosine-type recombinase/integrase [Blastococcus sp.]
MASIARRPDGTYRPRFRDETGKEHARHFKRKVDAQRWLDEQTAAMVTGAYVDPRAGRMTFAEYAEQWRATQVVRPTTGLAYERVLRRNVYPRLGTRPLASIRPSEIQGLVAWLSTDADGRPALAPRTVRVTLSVTSAVFKSAVRDRRLVSNPCAGVRLPEIHKSRVQPLQTSSVVALRDAMPPRWQAAVVLGAGTGVRQGELLGLTVDRIDFLRRQTVVDRQLINLPGQAPQLAPVKTRASVRTVPLPQTVVAALAEHLAAFPAESTGLVFVGDDGRPMMRSAWSGSVWRPAVKAAGLDFSVTFHALRHYYASLLIRHGESVKTVQARLGHSSAAQTLDVYSHLWPDSDDRTRDAVDAVLGAVADSVRTAEGAQA